MRACSYCLLWSTNAWKWGLEPSGLSGQQTVWGLFLSVTGFASFWKVAWNCVHAGSCAVYDSAQHEVFWNTKTLSQTLGKGFKDGVMGNKHRKEREKPARQSRTWADGMTRGWPHIDCFPLTLSPDAVLSWHGELPRSHEAQLLDSANGNVEYWCVCYCPHSCDQIPKKRSSRKDRLLSLGVQPFCQGAGHDGRGHIASAAWINI